MTSSEAPGWVATFAAVVGLSFLVGAVNPATIVARLLGRDIARSGSGNPGATNAGRVLGVGWGIAVGLLDAAKGFVPAFVAVRILDLPAAAGYAAGVAAVLGHVYSPFLRGHGGKGVATTFGAVLAMQPWYAVTMVGVFLVVVAVTRWVALASTIAAAGLVVAGIGAGLGWLPGGWPTAVWAVVLGGIVLGRHRRNVVERLRHRSR